MVFGIVLVWVSIVILVCWRICEWVRLVVFLVKFVFWIWEWEVVRFFDVVCRLVMVFLKWFWVVL